MIKLGGRKFIGFVCLCVLGLVMAVKGATLDNGVVTLLLGAYAIFAAANSVNTFKALKELHNNDADDASEEIEETSVVETTPAPLKTSEIDDQINLHLNNKVAPYIQQLAESDKQIQQVLSQIVSQMAQTKTENRNIAQKALNGENPFEHLLK